MTKLFRDEAVVLRTHKLGEADRIVVLLTRRRGKLRAVAKGVRRTKSRFGARLEPLSHVSLQLHEGRNLDIVTQAEAIDSFVAIRGDLDRLARAAAMLETSEQLALESEPNPTLYKTLVGALRTLEDRDALLVTAGFLLKMLRHEGVGPEVDACIECGASEELAAFSPEDGGVFCRTHRRGTAVSAEAIELLQEMLGGRLGRSLARPPDPASYEVDRLATRAMEGHIERRIRSLGVTETL